MADNRNNKSQDGNQNKGQVSQKPQRQQENNEGMGQQQSGNRGQQGGNRDAGNENREIQKDVDTDETDQGDQAEGSNEVTQRSPRQGDDQSR